jgi:hypothetical protein
MALQVTMPEAYKPAHLIGTAMGSMEAASASAMQDEQAAYENAVARARAEGERTAELAFQERMKQVELRYATELQNYQSQMQTAVAAYQSLYERANMIQTAAYQMEATVMQQQQQAVAGSQGARQTMASIADIICVFEPTFCRAGTNLRNQMTDDLANAAQRGRGGTARSLLGDLPDPAALSSQLRLPPPQRPAGN